MSPDVYDEMVRSQATHWWFEARRRILRLQLQQLRLPACARILEVGSGTGANLQLLADFGQVTGLEVHAGAIELAQRTLNGRSDVRLECGRWPQDRERAGEGFDLACLFDVLEHLDEDVAALSAVGLSVRPAGHVLITVPACPWLWGPHDKRLHHRRRYTRAALSAAISRAGLQLERISHFNTLLFPLACAGRAVERLRPDQARYDGLPRAALNRLLTTIFASERHLLARTPLPFGLSLLAIARIPGCAPATK